MSRYIVPLSEDYEPGSNNTVLRNKYHITSKKEMESLETEHLKATELELFHIYDQNHQFTSDDICEIHDLWLGDIYPFAGRYRTVTMEKDGFPFANPNLITKLMKKLELEYLAKYTPTHFSDIDQLALALAEIHVELILIHPFREGNGRIARLLSNLMVAQTKRTLMDFSPISQILTEKGFKGYISAIHAGHLMNYEPMQMIFKNLLQN